MVFQTKENPTFKDNDFTKDNAKLRIGDEVKKDLLQRVKDDVETALVYVLHLHEIVMNKLRKYRINIRKLLV